MSQLMAHGEIAIGHNFAIIKLILICGPAILNEFDVLSLNLQEDE
jgi:hypothetical protein